MALLVFGHFGCSRTDPSPPPSTVLATPLPEIPNAGASASVPAEAEPVREAATPEPRTVTLARPAIQGSPSELEARYFAATTLPEERRNIVRALGRSTNPEAGQVLRRVFSRERRFETRMEVLEVVADLPDERSHPVKIALFSEALAPKYPLTMRLSAMQTLSDLEDPQVPGLLRSLLRDSNQEIRENAARILRERP